MRRGDRAPDFRLPDHTGTERSLAEFLRQGPVVVFFYPAALTPGCTAESCHFRDLAAEFAAVGASRVGISRDPVDKQSRFAEQHDFDFPLLSDADGAVAAAYGVRRGFGPLPTKRHTFVVGTEQRILAEISSELRMRVHADKALAVLRDHQTS